jgi:hypothetical protein
VGLDRPANHYSLQKLKAMKRTDLQNIMAMAWRFFRTTGQTFSECLCKAWQNFKLVAAMRTRIVRFWFQKTDGTIREAWGTLRADLMPPTVGDDRKRNDTVQTYFDTERQEYRCFKRLNLVTIN